MIEYPFTPNETLLAFSLVFPPEKAREMTESIHRPPESKGKDGVQGWGITAETLMLYSIVSEALDRKVRAFIDDYWPGFDMDEWMRMRAQLKKSIEDGTVTVEFGSDLVE